MKNIYRYLSILNLLFIFMSCNSVSRLDGESQYSIFSPDGIPFTIADSSWNVDGLGNHRAIVSIENASLEAVKVRLPWRRPDLRPETKAIIVVNSETNEEIKNVSIGTLSSEEGILAFQPATSSKDYYIYYLPYKFRKGWDDARYGKPWNDYLPPKNIVDPEWEAKVKLNWDQIPEVKVRCFESRSKFDFFTSMGLIATTSEVQSLLTKLSGDFMIFPEDRAYPIRLTKSLPARWIKKDLKNKLEGYASPNEYYTWQLGIWTPQKDLKGVEVVFSDFIHSSGKSIIRKEEITCFNLEGTNWNGQMSKFEVTIPKGNVQALWCGMQIPENIHSGKYEGKATVSSKNGAPQVVDIIINVDNKILLDKGDHELWRHSRLRWLNSNIGRDSLSVAPYHEMNLSDNIIEATGKRISINKNGLPQIVEINGFNILNKPVDFIIETTEGPLSFDAENVVITKKADGLIDWHASSTQKGVMFECIGYMEYDGYIRYHLKLSSKKNIRAKNIKLITTYTSDVSEYFMGIGYKGGYRPQKYVWNWKGPWDSYWLGSDKAGLHVEFRGGSYHGPLINDYKPAPPKVWENNGLGRISLTENKDQSVNLIASTGESLISEKILDFEFSMLITPVKPLNTSKHFSERYYHADPAGFDEAAEEGANIANIHHSQKLNPVINYPFIVRDSLINYIQKEHQAGRKVKLYYTIRELTNYTTEIHALKSLNHEIFVSGVGYGVPWLCEHLIDDYKPAWYTELPGQFADAALVLNGFSRWINYYLEGLRWMFENYKIDGIYMDDVSFDREVMKRMRKIIAQYQPSAIIDLHSNTNYSIGPANQYTDFFPYVDRLWFGESFKYNQMKPDEWFVTFSGIPFGLMSEMLQDGGNRYLGMVYGATARHSYGPFSPAPVWSLWKSFDIEEATMIGYWDKECPIKTNHPNVKATVYTHPDKVLIAIGNFDSGDQSIHLSFDWKALGMNVSNVLLKAPFVEHFQEEQLFNLGQPILIRSKEGKLLILSKE